MSKPYILVVRQLGGIGDVLMMSCVYKGLREKYPKHTIKLVTSGVFLSGALIDVAEHNSYIDEIHVIEPQDSTPKHTKEVWHQYFGGAPSMEDDLIWQKAALAIDLNTPCVDYEWHVTPIVKPRWQIWCEAAGVVPSSYAPIYKITKDEAKAADEYAKTHWAGKQVVGLGLTANDKKRALGIGKLQTICEDLTARGLHVVTIDPTCSVPGYDYLVGKRIRDLIPLISKMNACISVDSGILHMAGAVQTPVIGIFGSTDCRMRMGNYIGSAIDSRRFAECAPCWYDYPCNRIPGNGHKPFECFSKIDTHLIVEETVRWVNKTSQQSH